MSRRCLSPHLDLRSPFVPSRLPSITRHDLSRRRRRRSLELRCQFGPESLFNILNSVPSLDLLAPVVGLVSSAAAVYLSRSPRRSDGDAAAGNWILFTSPTPFNRCVLLRCPSVSLEDDGVLANSLNGSLVREEQHCVNLSRGRIPLKDDGDVGFMKELKYQRVCVRTDDGGVISMDWPDNLDLEREHGLDTTILIVPGTPEGSMDMKVKLFVLDAIKHGCFPIVMNPRGCAGSPLTTTRLFTAADSDDVCTAVQYVNGIRPWTTLMGIGWGYGASMLTKYLCESGETTPVTASVCIDTPFDLEEYTKSSPHHVALNQKLTSGLREILRANKELFQGKTKGFDVAKALSATSVREFDGALSMVSYGFDALEDFYRKSSTRQLIDNLKIPILFIQSDDGIVPLFSIPHSSIADNPFTSLLLCSCVHSKINRSNQYTLLWSQQLAIEWLSAVEHALLKGRHPLLNDVDITIRPSKALEFINDGALEKSVQARGKTRGRYDSSQLTLKHNHGNVDSFTKPTSSLNVKEFLVDPSNNKVNGHNGALYDTAISHRNSRSKFYEVQRDDDLGTEYSRSEKLGTAEATPTESGANAISSEGSQVMQTATVVMNVLDATMPGTLDEQKKKVLGAMEQGETFMKALQGAVPEDVRGKITAAVAEVMQTQGTNLNLEAFKRVDWIPNMTSELKSKIQGKTKESSPKGLGSDDNPLEQIKVGNSNGDRTGENNGPFQEKSAQPSGSIEAGSDMEDKANPSNKSDQVGGVTNEDNGEWYKATEKLEAVDKKRDDGQVLGDNSGSATDSEVVDSSSQQNVTNLTSSEEASSAGPSTSGQVPEEGKGSQKNEENSDITGSYMEVKANPSDQVGGVTNEDTTEKVGNSNGDRTEENNGPSQEKSAQPSGFIEAGSDMEDKANLSNKSDEVGGVTNEDNGERYKATEKLEAVDKKRDDGQVLGDNSGSGTDSEVVDSSSQQSVTNLTSSEEASSAGSSTSGQVPGEGKGSQKNEENSNQDASSQIGQASSKSEEPSSPHLSSNSHSISVTQALDALTGFDDSTQMAVNNVFGVIEDMIERLEKRNQEDDDEAKKVEDQRSAKALNDSPLIDGEKFDNFMYIYNESDIGPDLSQQPSQPSNPSSSGGIESYEDGKNYMGCSAVNFSLAPSSDRYVKQPAEDDSNDSHLSSTNLQNFGDMPDLTLDTAMKRYWLSPYATYLHRYFPTPLQSQSSLDQETATDLFLDPEEGQWKMLDQPANSKITEGENGKDQIVNLVSGEKDVENVIKPSYVILDGEYSKFNNQLFHEDDIIDNEQEDAVKEKLFFLIKSTLLDDLRVEVGRRISMPDSKGFDSLLARDLENFTDEVSRGIVSFSDLNLFTESIGTDSVKFGTVEGPKTVEMILSALQDASHLKKVLPFGVIVSSSLASLKTYFHVVVLHVDATKKTVSPVNEQQRSHGHEGDIKDAYSFAEKVEMDENDLHLDKNKSISQGYEKHETVGSSKGSITAGAVTAALGASALGASALFANHQKNLDNKDESEGISSDFSNKRLFNDEESVQENNQSNLVSSLAEKAMSVAGPVVPTKSDGEVDHERLVAILAELGQKGGILRLVGKVALLWGGMRGAMSLTDRLIPFLHIAERPLFQRIFGFVCMVLVLWSPVVIPLLPTLVQSWTTHTPNMIAEFAYIVGLYVASMILVILWGKRIRGYANPIEQYGLDLTSVPRAFDFLKGLVVGIMLVSCIHSINALLGYASLSWPLGLPSSSSRAIALLKTYGSILLLIVRGIVSATGISIVEELLFRSWLAEEVAADLGYYHAIMISGLMFALIQRSLRSIPGFLFLSIFLFGIKNRAHGKLAAPIGVRTGLLTANFVVQNGNLLTYRADTPFWLASAYPWHPLDGAVGLGLCAILAIFFFPKSQDSLKKISRPIRE